MPRAPALFCLLFVLAALAQASLAGDARAQEGPSVPETFEIGLSSSRINVTSDFNGAELTVFGAIGNANMRLWREQRYDVVVVLFGPRKPLVVREKERFFGIWLNRDSLTIPSVPMTYSIATTRELRDIASPETLRRLSLGIGTLRFDGKNPSLGQPKPVFTKEAKFEDALRDLKIDRDLYTEEIGGVTYSPNESTLFRADLPLPADISIGAHTVRAYLFRKGQLVAQRSAELTVRKDGFQAEMDRFAATHGFLYGVCAVLLAIATGWIGRIVFKRD